jgi:protein-S-isoprenylcysteine O-methyltransferase Ste14
MGLRKTLTSQGNFLFRWRSYLPIAMLALLFLAVLQMQWPWGSHSVHGYIEISCLCISVLGLFVRIMVIGYTPEGTSGRNTAGQLANTLNTNGIYSVVRHPLYLGNFLIGLGPMMLPMIWWLPVIYCLAFALYYERIMLAEEAFLREKFGRSYEDWIRATPAFVPAFRKWKPSELPFSIRNVLKREYTAIAQILVGFFLVEILEHYVIDHRLVIEPFWALIGTVGVLQYFVLRTLKRHTGLLTVAGR